MDFPQWPDASQHLLYRRSAIRNLALEESGPEQDGDFDQHRAWLLFIDLMVNCG
jgi:hypothetical protein